MTNHEHAQSDEMESMLQELSGLLKISMVAKDLDEKLSALPNPNANMLLHKAQNGVLIAHTDARIAYLESRISKLHPEFNANGMSPEDKLRFHQDCYDQLCIMRAQLLNEDMKGTHLKSGVTTNEDGTLSTYLDPFLQEHLRRIAILSR